MLSDISPHSITFLPSITELTYLVIGQDLVSLSLPMHYGEVSLVDAAGMLNAVTTIPAVTITGQHLVPILLFDYSLTHVRASQSA